MVRRLITIGVLLATLVGGTAVTPLEAAVPPLGTLDQLVIDLTVNDLVYDEVRNLFYGSVPSTDSAHPNKIIAFDEQGVIAWSVFAGSEPTVMAMSDDGSFLYVGLDGAGAVARVNLSAKSVDLTFSLGSGAFGTRFPEDITVLPAAPGSVAISLYRKNVSPRHDGVAVFDDGVQRSNITQDHTGSNRIEPSNTAARLYGYNSETSEHGFRRLTVDGDGVVEQDVTLGLIAGFGVDIVYASGRIYSTNGTIVNAEARTLIGSFVLPQQFGNSVAPDPSAGRVFFLHSFPSTTITMYNSNTFAFLDSVEVPEANDSADGLIRWGDSGLAFFTEDQVVVLGDLGFGTISGHVFDDVGSATALGIAEVYDADLNFIAAYPTAGDGSYQTESLIPGTYHVLLYNGDETTFFDFFPEWFKDAPLLRLDLATAIQIDGNDVTGIDAFLNPLFFDMFDTIFLNDIAFLQEAGITKGCNPPKNDLFCPDDFVTRGQMAAFLVRALGYTDNGGGDLFVDDDTSIFENDIDKLGTAGVTRGCNPPKNDRFCPNDFVTRGQMAAFLNRALAPVFLLQTSDSAGPYPIFSHVEKSD